MSDGKSGERSAAAAPIRGFSAKWALSLRYKYDSGNRSFTNLLYNHHTLHNVDQLKSKPRSTGFSKYLQS